MAAGVPVFSRPVLVASLPDDGTTLRVEATVEERAALADANGLVALRSLAGDFDLEPQKRGDGVVVRGVVSATIVQTCTVSLDAFESEVREEVDLVFMQPDRAAAWVLANKSKEEPGLADEDPPELLADGRIDLGAVTAEFLALGIDPYPRKPGARFEPDSEAEARDPSPFAALARLRDKS